MKQSLLLFCASFLFVHSALGQDHQIIGTVRSADGRSLAYAHVLDVNSRKAVAADALGKFQLAVADSGTVLRVSHVGFRPVLHTISREDLAQNHSHISKISITLAQESTLLSAAVASANDMTVIDGTRGVVLHDFSFAHGENILLMAQDGIRYLMLCDDDWKEISRISVDKKGDRLDEDCLGNAHLYGEDSVYQIGTDGNELELFHASEQTYFLEQMAHCATSSTSHIFFSSYQKAGQEVHHYGLDRSTKQGIILQYVYDHEGLQDIEDYFKHLPDQRVFNSRFRMAGSSYANERLEAMQTASCDLNGNRPFASGFMGRCIDPLVIYRYHRGMESSWSYRNTSTFRVSLGENFGDSQSSYFQSVSNRQLEYQQAMLNTWSPSPRDRGWIDLLRQPTYSPMFNLRDSIFVFDHVVGICHVHDTEGQKVRSFPIEHHELKGWQKMLLRDENGQKLYAHIRQRNKLYLMEIDLNDGSIARAALLPNANFVDHLKVKDGHAYYLKEYRDILSSDRMLRQRL